MYVLPACSFCYFLSVGNFVLFLICLAFLWMAFIGRFRGRHYAKGPCLELCIHYLTSLSHHPVGPVQSIPPFTAEETDVQ